MDHRFLEHQYFQMRERQVRLHGRSLTAMDRKASQVIFNTAIQAIENVKTGNRTTCMQAVSLSTGLGKSTSAYALIATFAQHDPQFSAAYVVPTIKMAIEAQEEIELLLGPNTTTLWSSYHKHKGVDARKAVEALGFLPARTVNKADLPTSRIIIVTHDKLKHELQSRMKEGCTTYCGKPRSIVFIDEHPELVQVVHATPERLQSFHDQLVKLNTRHPWLPVVSAVVSRMSALARSEGQPYVPIELLSPDEARVFDDDAGLSLWELTDDELSQDMRFSELEGMRSAVAFLLAAVSGNAFYSRRDWSFFAYQLHFASDYPGFVLLDATSDLTGLVSLHPHVRLVDVPPVSYERLELFHMDVSTKFKRINDVIKSAATGREYGRFIFQSVIANSQPGDEVLVVVHKNVLGQELIPMSEDPGQPMDWEGRKVNTQNWGAGIGLNKFKHKTHVFLFGDYYLPRPSTIAQAHGWSQEPLSEECLRHAEGRRQSGDLYAPRGGYLRVHEGHQLRWIKQLAMRGTARQVDGDGRCYPMKLFTTMDLSLLLPNLHRLFPNARPPLPAMASDQTGDEQPVDERPKLTHFWQ